MKAHGRAERHEHAAAVATADIAIRATGLTRRFGELTVVDGLSFEVRRGELFGLVGPDGAGKTTTLRMLAAVLRPTTGDALVNGVSVVGDPESVKADLAYMSQRFGLYGDLTVLENLHFYADLYETPKKDLQARIERLFRFSNLAPFKDRLARDLSGGMKQKLGLSCALIHEPEILLLDEPTFGVDPISRRDLWLIIHDMVARGVPVVVSTAYMDEAERFDRLALLHRGRPLAFGTPEELRGRIRGQMVTVAVDRLREAREVVARQPGVRHAAVFGERLHAALDPTRTDGAALESVLRQQGFEAAQVRPLAPSLEDVFIDLIKTAEALHEGSQEDVPA